MNRLLSLLLLALLFLTGPTLVAQSLLRRLTEAHATFWSEAFGDRRWRGSAVGFIVVKRTGMLHVVRQGTRRDTVASFPVCAMPTMRGFKIREGDGQTPEGIYHISLLNPASRYHLSMKVDYPNAVDNARYDRYAHQMGERWSQGGDIFIHGDCVSIGCIAMTDEVIEKLYLLAGATPASRGRIRVLVLPCDTEDEFQRLIAEAVDAHRTTGDAYSLLLRDHLQNMHALWRYYRRTGRIPDRVASREGLYVIPPLAGASTSP